MTQQRTEIAWPDVDGSRIDDGAKSYPPGEYVVVLTKLTPILAKSGNPAAEFRARILEGAHEGGSLTWTRSLQPQAVWSFARDCAAFLGDELPRNENGTIPGAVLASLSGRMEGAKAVAVVSNQLYDDGALHGLTDKDGNPITGRYTTQVDSCRMLDMVA